MDIAGPGPRVLMRTGLVALLLLPAVALAGCTGEFAGDLEPLPPPERPPVPRWTFDAGSSDELPRSEGLPLKGQYRLTGFQGAEPNLGITSIGSVFMTSFDDTLRWVPGEGRWQSVYEFEPSSATPGETHTADPMLWVDPVTDRIYSSHMFPAIVCMAVSWSDNDGADWTTNEASCTIPGLDHQKFFSAPPGPLAPPVAGLQYPTVAYQCYQRVAGTEETGYLASGFATFCNLSYDGGETWPAETLSAARLPAGSCGGINGHPAFAPDGTVVVPITRGCDGLYISVSQDSGLTWTVRPGPTSVGADSIDPDVTFGPDGSLYAVWRGSDMLLYLARSADLGLTWDGPWRISPPHVTSTVFQVAAAADNGGLAFGFLGTADWDGDPSLAPEGTIWHLYLGATQDAAAETPRVTVVQATVEGDPAQNGCVWLNGGGNPCRNMLDFIDAALHPDGTFYVAWTKGCNEGCISDDDKSSMTAIAWLDGWSGTDVATSAQETATGPNSRPFEDKSPMVFKQGGA